MAVKARIQGVVILDATVCEEGEVMEVRLLRSANPLLDREAVAAVRQWRYSPIVLNGIRVPFILTVTLSFFPGAPKQEGIMANVATAAQKTAWECKWSRPSWWTSSKMRFPHPPGSNRSSIRKRCVRPILLLHSEFGILNYAQASFSPFLIHGAVSAIHCPDLDPALMNIVTRWLRQPQRVWLRRAVFQVHLWMGLALGLYVVVLSLTGSALVYRAELDRLLASPRAALNERAMPMTADELRSAAANAHPGWTVTEVHEGSYRGREGGRGGSRRAPDPTATIVLEREGQTRDRLFDPYTGADLGESTTRGQFFVLWLVRLHDDLLLERPDGPWLNGALSLVFTLSVVSGGIVWWPGLSRWKRSLGVKVTAGWRRFNWDLHSALGFWLFAFMLMWGISGWYMGMPDPLTSLVERFSDPEGPYGERLGDRVLEWLPRLHFGRWRDPTWGPWLKAAWAAIGLVPAVMFVTGLIMWWNRVVRRRRSAAVAEESPAYSPLAS